MRFQFEITYLPKLPNQIRGLHWGERVREFKIIERMIRDYIFLNKIELPAVPLKKAVITLTRFSARECDADNAYGAAKIPIDVLKRIGIIVDDKPSVIGTPVIAWHPAKRNQGKTVILVEEIAEGS